MEESKEDFEKEIFPLELMEILKDKMNDIFLLDVREPIEYEIARIKGSTLIPLKELPQRIHELEKVRNGRIVVYCHHGIRSLNAVAYLKSRGFPRVKSLKGGIDAWSLTAAPSVPRY